MPTYSCLLCARQIQDRKRHVACTIGGEHYHSQHNDIPSRCPNHPDASMREVVGPGLQGPGTGSQESESRSPTPWRRVRLTAVVSTVISEHKIGIAAAVIAGIVILNILNKSEDVASDVASNFIGQWSGNVTQTGPPLESSRLPAKLLPKLRIGPWIIGPQSKGSDNTEYPAVITIRSGKLTERVGTVNYATLGCSGELILTAASSTQILVEESLTSGLSTCINHTIVTLTLNADRTLDYSVQASTESGSAVLRKAG